MVCSWSRPHLQALVCCGKVGFCAGWCSSSIELVWRSKSGAWILVAPWAALIIFFTAPSASLLSFFSSRQSGCCSLLEKFKLVHDVIQPIGVGITPLSIITTTIFTSTLAWTASALTSASFWLLLILAAFQQSSFFILPALCYFLCSILNDFDNGLYIHPFLCSLPAVGYVTTHDRQDSDANLGKRNDLLSCRLAHCRQDVDDEDEEHG